MEKFENMKAILEGLNEDVQKFNEKGNKAAGTRIRKGLQEIKNVAQELRIEISAKKNA